MSRRDSRRPSTRSASPPARGPERSTTAHRRPASVALPPQTLTLTIAALGSQGDGVARHLDAEIFIPYTLPGERVAALLDGRRGDGLTARVLALETLADERVEPPCPHFGTCGGCALQHMAPSALAVWKRDQLVTAMGRAGVEAARVAPMIAIPPGTRRRATFAYRRLGAGIGGGRISLGFTARGSHTLIDLTTCPLLTPALTALLPALRTFLASTVEDGAAGDVAATLTLSGIDVLIDGAARLDLAARQSAAAFADAADLARLSWRLPSGLIEPLSCRRQPRLEFGDTVVEPPPGGFLQPCVEGEATLARLVADGVGCAARVADLYAGCGSFTFRLAEQRAVHAVEGDAAAAHALQVAARRSGKPVTLEHRDLGRRPLSGAELRPFQAVVFDPPRAGAAAQAAALAEAGPSRVIAVSCNPATLARDARLLIAGGYTLCTVTPVDQFPWSAHLEAVAVFER